MTPLEQTILEIREKYGEEAVEDGKRLTAFLSDFQKGRDRDIKMIGRMFEDGINERFRRAKDGEIPYSIAVADTKKEILEKELVIEARADYYTEIFACIYGFEDQIGVGGVIAAAPVQPVAADAVDPEKEKAAEKFKNSIKQKNDPNYYFYDAKRDEEPGKAPRRPNHGGEHIHPFNTVEGFCKQFGADLQEEINFQRKTGGTKYQLAEGRLVEIGKRGGFTYSYDSESELHLPDGSEIRIWLNQNTWQPGNIVSCDDYAVMFHTADSLGNPQNLPEVEISSSPWQILDKLKTNIDTLQVKSTPITDDLILHGYDHIQGGVPINKGQDLAESMASNQPITFIWGPPGTGKTTTLANIVKTCLAENRRVLMVSYSNVAVDDATWRVYNVCKSSVGANPGKLVRYGYPRDEELLNHPFLTSYNMALHANPDLLSERDDLLDQLDITKKGTSEYKQIKERLRNIRTQLADAEVVCVHQAMFVATTVTKAVSDPLFDVERFDTVLFDEASMAYIPQVVYASTLADKHFVCLGDFCQLPPIVSNRTSTTLNSDIFEYCGIQPAVEQGWGHDWLCMLDEQYRMYPDICDFISKKMYFNLLKSNMQVTKNEKRVDIVSKAPAIGTSIGIADLSGFRTYCRKNSGYSHFNVFSAFVDYANAVKAIGEDVTRTVGIIAPYNAQSRLITTMVRDTFGDPDEAKAIVSATVHQFQGSEKDIIIYDSVDCEPLKKPGGLIVDTKNSKRTNTANRLFNVAMSRAEGKFLVVTNKDFDTRGGIGVENIFKQLLSDQGKEIQTLSDKSILPAGLPSFSKMAIFGKTDGLRLLNEEIQKVKKSIYSEIVDDREIARNESMLPVLKNMLSDGDKEIIFRVRTLRNIPSQLKEAAIDVPFVFENVIILDGKIVWYFGDMSSDNCPAIRFEGSHTARMLTRSLRMKWGKAVKLTDTLEGGVQDA